MARKVYFSFHFDNDCWRTQQIRNIGSIEGNHPISANAWEVVKRNGERSIQNWIDENLKNKSCCIVLVGSQTANRKWVKYEIRKAWEMNKGVVGINIHNLKDSYGNQSLKGDNPFSPFKIENDNMSEIAKVYNPPYPMSTDVYNHIKINIEAWVEEAITIRSNYQ